MLVTPYMGNTLYLAQKSLKLKLTSLAVYSVFYQIFIYLLKTSKCIFEGAISLKATSIYDI